MSHSSLHPTETGDPRAANPGGGRRFQVGMRGLVVAVACFGFMAWAGRTVWENQHPAIAAARGLRSRDAGDRVEAARLLASLGIADPDRAIPPLVASMDDPDVDVRSTAVGSLGAIINHLAQSGDASPHLGAGIGSMIAAIRDRELSVRIAATTALHSLAQSKVADEVIDIPAITEAIATALDDRDESVRLGAFAVLAQFGPIATSGPPAPLVGALADRSPKVRTAAIKALAAFPVPLDPWLDTVLDGLEHGEPEVRAACWLAFVRKGPPPVSPDARPRLVAVLLEILRKPPVPGGTPLVAPGMYLSVWAVDPPSAAALLLGQLAPETESAAPVIAALTEVLRSGPPARWPAAADALGDFGPAAEPAVPMLIRVLREDIEGRPGEPYHFSGGPAARALGQIAPGTRSAEEAIGALIDALPSDPKIQPMTRLGAIDALGAFGPAAARAVPRIREYQKSKEAYFRLAAEKALAAIEVGEPASQGGAAGR